MSGCMSSMFNNEITSLCAPLQRLKDEHGPLNLQKSELYSLSSQIEKEGDEANWGNLIMQLREKVIAFIAELEPHSEREEGVLFPMMAKYIGNESGPIAVMEYEHDQAKWNIAKFIELTENLTTSIEKETAQKLASYITTAYLILTDHFSKEENVLFPMAENILTDEEKEILEQKINEI